MGSYGKILRIPDREDPLVAGRSTLDQLSKLPWKHVSKTLSWRSASAARIYDLLHACADEGNWALFREAMEIVPDGCMTNVVQDAGRAWDVFCGAADHDDMPVDVLSSMMRRFPGLTSYRHERTRNESFGDSDSESDDDERRTGDGSTILHALCYLPGRLELINEYISESAKSSLPARLMQNMDGDTPLHHAILQNPWEPCTIRIIEALARAYPEMVTMPNRLGSTPLHTLFMSSDHCDDVSTIIKILMDAQPSVTTMQDARLFTPLHAYFYRRGMGRITDIKELLRADPKVTTITCDEERSPFDMLWMEHSSHTHEAFTSVSSNCYESLNTPPVEYKCGAFGEFWSRATLLLLAATTGGLDKPIMATSNAEPWRAVDAMAQLGALVPWSMFWVGVWEHFGHPEKPDADGMLPMHVIAKGPTGWLNECSYLSCPIDKMLKEYPDSVEMQDLKGRLPLHIASASSYHEDDRYGINDDAKTNITRLVAAYPEGAGEPTCGGNFPLHLAIKSKKRWLPDIHCILEAAPHVSGVPDPCSHLYPFMMAAVGETASESVVYELLRRDPSLVKTGVRETEDEKYLKRRIRDMDCKLRELENNLKGCNCVRKNEEREGKRVKRE